MGELVVVTGPPGAGKSTVAARVADLLDPSALVPGDAVFGFLRRGAVPPWLPAAEPQNEVVVEAAARAAGHLTRLAHVVYDGVLGPWSAQRFLAASGLDVMHYVVLRPPLRTCLAGVRDRVGHGFTDLAAAEHMWHAFDAAPLEARHLVPQGSGDGSARPDAESTAQRVAELVAGGGALLVRQRRPRGSRTAAASSASVPAEVAHPGQPS